MPTVIAVPPVRVATRDGERTLTELGAPLALDRLVPGDGPWEVELGFGKGSYLLRRAVESPERRFLGLEMASRYYRLARDRAARRGLGNLALVATEALFALSTLLPRGFAAAVHVYFPDPWPKSRHERRRLFDPESVDLVAGLLEPGGRFAFATDHAEYGERVAALLDSYPPLEVERRRRVWDDGPRTNYERKYVAEGRPIVRLEGRLAAPAEPHPTARAALVAATAPRPEPAS